LEDLLERRGRVAGQIHREKRTILPLTNPYVAAEPDGPLVESRADFVQVRPGGRSRSSNPELQGCAASGAVLGDRHQASTCIRSAAHCSTHPVTGAS
jgi:hypothetical protein